MRAYRLTVAYDGTDFHGWQVQPGLRTIEGELRRVATAVFGAEPQGVRAAGRTDAGVHARGQVVSLAVESALPAPAVRALLNRGLPADVRVRAAADVAPGFDARRDARARRYAYRLLREDDVIHARYAWFPGGAVDADRLECATRPLEGVQDCSALRSTGSSPAHPVCRVLRAGWSAWEGGLRLDVVADHFLYHMVRAIVGTALAAARTADPAAAMRAVIASRERSRAGINVPARGLCLEQVFYAGEALP